MSVGHSIVAVVTSYSPTHADPLVPQRGAVALLCRVLSWSAVPAVLVMSLFDLRRGLTGHPAQVSSFAIGAGVAVLLGLPLLVRAVAQRKALRIQWAVIGVFTVLLLYSLVSAFSYGQRWSYRTVVPRSYLLMPLLEALLTCLLGLVLALATPVAQRRHRFWLVSWSLLVGSCIGWLRGALKHGVGYRLNTGFGGAATVQVALLLALAGFIGCLADAYRRRSSLVGAVLAAGLILSTQSRVGLGLLVLLAGISWVQMRGRRVWRELKWLIAGGLILAVVVAVLPIGRRLIQMSTGGRSDNLIAASKALDSLGHWVVGVGLGTVWPWFIYDAGLTTPPWPGRTRSPFGIVATNPHSLFLGPLVELGLIGLLLVVALLVLTVRGWWAVRRRQLSATVDAGAQKAPSRWAYHLMTMVALSWIAFAFDYYLLKNFAVSFLWWYALFMTLPADSRPPAERASARQIAEVEAS